MEDAVTAAVSGAAGLSGAGLGAFVARRSAREQDERTERRADRERQADLRGIARLVTIELKIARQVIEIDTAVEVPRPGQHAIPPIPSDAWERYAPTLMAQLPVAVADAVATAYTTMWLLRRGEEEDVLSERDLAFLVGAERELQHLDGIAKAQGMTFIAIDRAREALGPWVRDEPQGEPSGTATGEGGATPAQS